MKQQHPEEDELIAHYYGESAVQSNVEAHLRTCGACRNSWERLRDMLNAVDLPAPEPDEHFESRMWWKLAGRLEAVPRRWWQTSSFRIGLASALATLLVIAAFLAGRYSSMPDRAAPVVAERSGAESRVLMAALSEHLHQSQLILAEIANAAPEHADLALQRALAEHLLASNRLLRQTAGQSGHHSLAGTLDELERVLLEVAHGSPQGVEPLQAQIEDDAILFKIRLLNSTLKNPGNWDSF